MPTTATVDGIELRVKYASNGASDSINRLRAELRALAGVLPSTVNGLNSLAKSLEKVSGKNTGNAIGKAATKAVQQASKGVTEATKVFSESAVEKGVFGNADFIQTYNSLDDLKRELEAIREVKREIDSERNTAFLKDYDSFIKSLGSNDRAVGEFTLAWRKAVDGVKSAWNGLFGSIGRIAFYRAIRALIKMVTQAAKEGVENISQYSKAVGDLGSYGSNANAAMSEFATLGLYVKNSVGAALIPVLHALVPAAQSVANAFVAATNAIARFLSVIGGKATFTKAKMYAVDYADSLKKGAGGAAKAVKEFETGIDELNVLSDKAGSGGGGGADAMDFSQMFEEAATGVSSGGFLSQLALTVDDVLFKWKDLNGEIIAEKLIAGLFGLLLGLGGFLVTGSFTTGILFSILGVGLGLVVDTLVFDHDGHISGSELGAMIMGVLGGLVGGFLGYQVGGIGGALIGFTIGAAITMAVTGVAFKNATAGGMLGFGLLSVLTAALGGLIGFTMLGGMMGAAIGATLGLSITLLVANISFGQQQALRDAFYSTEFGQQIAGIKANFENIISESMALQVDIKSITGKVDSNTVAIFEEAADLIEKIFTINDKENLTSVEAGVLKDLVEQLNSLGLGPIITEFDTTTGKVMQTREEVEKLMDALWKEYEMEALKNDIVKALSERNDARGKYNEALKESSTLYDTLQTEIGNLEELEKQLAEASGEAEGKMTSMAEIADRAWNPDRVEKVKALRDAIAEQKTKVNEIESAYKTGLEAINSASQANEDATKKVNELKAAQEELLGITKDSSEQATNSGKDIETAYTGVKDKSTEVTTAVKEDLGTVKTEMTDTATQTHEAMLGESGVKASITTAFEDSVEPVDKSMSSIWESVKTFGNNIIDKFREIGEAIKELNSMETDIDGESFRFSDAPGNSFPQYASGGFPEEGSLFWAQEAGPELVGTIGGQSAVANSDQIIQGVASGVAAGMRGANADVVSTLYGVIDAIESKNLNISDKQIGYANARFNTSRGVNLNRGAFANAY